VSRASRWPDSHHVVTDDGGVIAYDALLIAVGALQRGAGPHMLTFGRPGTEEQMHGLVQDIEEGWVRRVAFVVPADATWPVPLYELALMTAERAYGLCQRSELTFVTAEPAPLALFGPPVSRALTKRLNDAGIEVHTAVATDVPARGLLELHPSGERLTVDRVVTLPSLDGPRLEGLPHDAHGFLVVDGHCRVRGASDVYAAGDATHHTIKQGGLACQQADAAADAIAAQAGAAIEPELHESLLEGILLTERTALFMRRESRDDTAVCSAVARRGRSWPSTKIAGRELAAHLSDPQRDTAARAINTPPSAEIARPSA
jgi:sulfide:quinone oxidoreductase